MEMAECKHELVVFFRALHQYSFVCVPTHRRSTVRNGHCKNVCIHYEYLNVTHLIIENWKSFTSNCYGDAYMM